MIAVKPFALVLFFSLFVSPAVADDTIVIKKIVDQKVEGKNIERRFVLTNCGIIAKLGNGKYYYVRIERGYAGLGSSDIIVDIKDEGEYGVQMYYTATRKQLLTGPNMHRVEAGLQTDPGWAETTWSNFPDKLKKAFKTWH